MALVAAWRVGGRVVIAEQGIEQRPCDAAKLSAWTLTVEHGDLEHGGVDDPWSGQGSGAPIVARHRMLRLGRVLR